MLLAVVQPPDVEVHPHALPASGRGQASEAAPAWRWLTDGAAELSVLPLLASSSACCAERHGQHLGPNALSSTYLRNVVVRAIRPHQHGPAGSCALAVGGVGGRVEAQRFMHHSFHVREARGIV